MEVGLGAVSVAPSAAVDVERPSGLDIHMTCTDRPVRRCGAARSANSQSSGRVSRGSRVPSFPLRISPCSRIPEALDHVVS